MARLDRAKLLATLAALDNSDDVAAADAGRAATALLAEAGLGWADVVLDEAALAALDDGGTTSASAPAEAAAAAASNEDALVLIDRLLARSSLDAGKRDELNAYKQDIASGEFDKEDIAYLNALYARVMMGKTEAD